MSAVEIKFAVFLKQPYGFGDMMSGFGPKDMGPQRQPSCPRRSAVEEQVDDQRRDGDQKDVHEKSASTIRQTTHPEAVFLDGFRGVRGFERCQGAESACARRRGNNGSPFAI